MVEEIQALWGVPPEQLQAVLRALSRDVELVTRARGVRANVMLPTGRGTKIVTYQFGMDDDSDRDLELGLEAGCSGAAWKHRSPRLVDLEHARRGLVKWNMTDVQQRKVRFDRRALASFPLFEAGTSRRRAAVAGDLAVIGVLSIDSETPLQLTGWVDDLSENVDRLQKEWGGVISRILS
jgi:hypothetical protein